MKTMFFKSALLLAIIFGAINAKAQWAPVGTLGISAGGTSTWQHVVTDSSTNNVYVSFNDAGLTAGQGTVMKFNGSSWSTLGNPGFTAGSALHSSFCLGPNGTAYFSYADGNDSSQGAVMMYNGSSWSSIGTNLTIGACQYSNISADASGAVYFSGIDVGSGGVVVKQYTGNGNWQNLGAGPVSAGPAAFVSMGINRQSSPVWVAYMDVTAGMKAVVKKFVSPSWVTVGTPFLSTGSGSAFDISLAFGDNDTPYVAYWNPAPSGPKPSVQKWDGSNWISVGTPGFTSGFAQYTSLIVAHNTPYLGFMDVMDSSKAYVMKFNGSSWVNLGSPANVSTHGSSFTSLAADRNGNLYMGFSDNSDSEKTSVSKYTMCSLATINSASSSAATICHGDTVMLMANGALNDATHWNWYRNSCGGIPVDTGVSIHVIPASNTTYYLRGEGGCVVSSTCAPVSITVNTVPTPTIRKTGLVLASSSATGNQWKLGGIPLPGSNGATHTATVTGWYSVTVTAGNCSKTSDSVFVTVTPSGVSNMPLASLVTIAPMPVQQSLTVTINTDQPALSQWQLALHDYTGRTIYMAITLQRSNKIDVGNLLPGFYFLKLSDGNKSQMYKIVKE